MDNPAALQKFDQHLRRRSPDRSTPLHYLSDLRQFFAVCTKPWALGRRQPRRCGRFR